MPLMGEVYEEDINDEESSISEDDVHDVYNHEDIMITEEVDNIEDFVVVGGDDDIPQEKLNLNITPQQYQVIIHLWLKQIILALSM